MIEVTGFAKDADLQPGDTDVWLANGIVAELKPDESLADALTTNSPRAEEQLRHYVAKAVEEATRKKRGDTPTVRPTA